MDRTQAPSKSLRKLWLSLISAIVLVSALLLLIQVRTTPQDLGPQLEYIGKEDFGCLPFPLFFICPSPKGSNYYFATDMSIDEIKGYFKRAHNVSADRETYPLVSEASTRTQLGFELNQTAEQSGFSIHYYDYPDTVLKENGLHGTEKKYIISLLDSSYEIAKLAL